MTKSNTNTRPPIHSHFPWLVYSYGERFDAQMFYDVEEGNRYIKQIPDMSNKIICANSHGWMVMLDLDLNSSFLLNPVSMEKIILPPWQSPRPTWVCCILSLPPSDPKCIVAFFTAQRPYIMFCHPNDKVWREKEFDITNFKFNEVVSFEGKIYCLNGLDGSLMELKVLNNYMLQMTQLVKSPHDPLLNGEEHNGGQCYLVESLGEIFLVTLTLYKLFKNRIREVCVYKMDLRKS